MSMAEQNHLNYNDRVNLGSYYTQTEYVDIVWAMIANYLSGDTVILDTSCGYGNFLNDHSQHKKNW